MHHHGLVTVLMCALATHVIGIVLPPSIIKINDTVLWTETLANQSEPILVMFYSSKCGACHHFSPLYSELVKVFDNVQDQELRFGAVDCSTTSSGPICVEQRIRAYPSMYLYTSQVQRIPRYHNVTKIQETLFNYLN